MPGEVVARRTEIARERWEAMTTWPLIAASVLFLVAYSWGILDSELTPGGLLAIGLVLGLVWLAFLVDYVVRILLSVDKLYFVALLQSCGNTVKNGGNGLFSVFLSEAGFSGNSIDKISFIHV